ncbi:PNGase F N-terminal domain-containing protein [Bacteroidota bacterium]
MKNLLFILATSFILFSCGPDRLPSIGDHEIEVFKNEHLYFDPKLNEDTISGRKTGIYRISSGRVLLKQVAIPEYRRNTDVSINVTVTSAGDRWDKSGSCFLIPAESEKNFLGLQNKTYEWSEFIHQYDSFPGIVQGKGYKPVIELMRFMTPFGVGYYSDSMEFRKPVYIPHWEKEVSWTQKITDRISRIQGNVWVGVWIDTWTKEGYNVSVNLNFDETDAEYWPATKTYIEPLVNTVPYIDGQRLFDMFASTDLETNITITPEAKNIRLYYLTTGHGGHSGGDEFVKKENKIYLDSKEIYSFIPWRDDCASFRRFNPHSGVWMMEDTIEYIDWEVRGYRKKVIEERVASSDFSRSNWCPGSDVMPEIIELGDIPAGVYKLRISIPEAQELEENKFNHWLVSAWLNWEE